jgi:ferredoxin-NADP reductase
VRRIPDGGGGSVEVHDTLRIGASLTTHGPRPFIDEVARFGGRVAIRTDDVSGLPTASELLGHCPDGTAVYACGPAPMLTAIRAELAGRDNVELHFERFAAPPVVDERRLSALDRTGVRAPYSCRQGFCGTCRTRVLDGIVDHRDTLLPYPERDSGMMLICTSRGVEGSRLTLDL